MPLTNESRQTAQQRQADDAKESTSLNAMSPTFVQSAWAAGILAVLVAVWCVVDFWNHEMSTEFFMMQQYAMPHEGSKTLESPLTLAFIQFVFMGVIFLAVWAATTKTLHADVSELKDNIFDVRWTVMAVTHVFSTFWLQAMMMPTQVMTLGIFAASRAVEVPATAVLRSQVIGSDVRIQSAKTSMLMFGAAFTLFYSYSQIAECLCIWSGHGITLSGVALYVVYALVLFLPATNAVCQEALMVKFGTNSFLILGVQNILACAVCAPFLIWAQCSGWENIAWALQTITTHKEMIMLVLWLCIQMTVLSVAGIQMIARMDSFWAVAFRSFRVVVWWCREVFFFYMMSKVSLSIAEPNKANWSLVLLCGIMAAVAAMVNDNNDSGKHSTSKSDTLEATYKSV